jgi:hypothetical protein
VTGAVRSCGVLLYSADESVIFMAGPYRIFSQKEPAEAGLSLKGTTMKTTNAPTLTSFA